MDLVFASDIDAIYMHDFDFLHFIGFCILIGAVFFMFDWLKSASKMAPEHRYLLASTKFSQVFVSLSIGVIQTLLQMVWVGPLLFLLAMFVDLAIDQIGFLPSGLFTYSLIKFFWPNALTGFVFFWVLVNVNATRHMLREPKTFFEIDKDTNSIVLKIEER